MHKPIERRITSSNPYREIREIIEQWCSQNRYGDVLVTISVNGEEITEYLSWEPYEGFVWDMDWWEGEKEVILMGFRMRHDLTFYGFPEKSE